ncbi:MAG: cryptochrome/photolyase family protein [Thermoanaerobaculia bacterium]
MAPAIVWFRRDLRLDDHLPLDAALRGHEAVVPVLVLDAYDRNDDFSPPRLRFLAESLRELEAELAARGSRLLVRNGPAGEALAALARETGADTVYAHDDHEPHGRALAREVEAALAPQGTRLRLLPDVHLVPPGSLRTDSGRPYTVFTPFLNRWREADKAAPRPAPPRVPTPEAVLDPSFPSIPLSRPRALRETGAPANPPGGAREARRLWDAFRETALVRYAGGRDVPAVSGTSRLSPHLRFGTIGIRRLLAEARAAWKDADAPGRASIDVFVSELAWREFYASILSEHPRVLSESFRTEFERFPWSGGEEAEERFAAWRDGRTGYPIVDAGMRQLAHEGWMHNRVRMIVASFLTKHLLVDWRRGEALFRARLADGDPASNNGGWQWSAGCGTDAQPFFRIFNPVLQGERFDPDGAYVKRWVPELAAWKGAGRNLHAPWRASSSPADYPAPVVDHGAARARALAALDAIRGAAGAPRP